MVGALVLSYVRSASFGNEQATQEKVTSEFKNAHVTVQLEM